MEIMQIRDFLFSAGSFGSDHSKLEISRKDDGDAYWKMEIPAEANYVKKAYYKNNAPVVYSFVLRRLARK